MRHFALYSLALFFNFYDTEGHGAMYYPMVWHATSECTPDMSPHDCKFTLKVPDPPGGETCTHNSTTNGCSRQGSHTAWFTNFTSVPEVTLQEEMFDAWQRRDSAAGLHPWNSPGAAPTFGNGCGLNGGNPDGCDGEDLTYGRCCGGGAHGMGCGGYVGGKSALEHYDDGLFGTPHETKWKRGEPQEVYWNSGAKHRGGYAYRLCRVHNGKYSHVTEQCFQEGHLKFHGNTAWIYWHPNDEYFHEDGWLPIPLVTTTHGTTPEGSEWAKIDLPHKPEKDDAWAFKDLVEVPESLEPGHYVLSFRWDCQDTPQVWNACANIHVV